MTSSESAGCRQSKTLMDRIIKECCHSRSTANNSNTLASKESSLKSQTSFSLLCACIVSQVYLVRAHRTYTTPQAANSGLFIDNIQLLHPSLAQPEAATCDIRIQMNMTRTTSQRWVRVSFAAIYNKVFMSSTSEVLPAERQHHFTHAAVYQPFKCLLTSCINTRHVPLYVRKRQRSTDHTHTGTWLASEGPAAAHLAIHATAILW